MTQSWTIKEDPVAGLILGGAFRYLASKYNIKNWTGILMFKATDTVAALIVSLYV